MNHKIKSSLGLDNNITTQAKTEENKEQLNPQQQQQHTQPLSRWKECVGVCVRVHFQTNRLVCGQAFI